MVTSVCFFSSFLLSFCFSNQGKISSCNNWLEEVNLSEDIVSQPGLNMNSFSLSLLANSFKLFCNKKQR